jgi:hypothetical protein
MARMDFGDLDLYFSHKEISEESYSKLKEKYIALCQTLCSKYESISESGIQISRGYSGVKVSKSIEQTIYKLVEFNDEKKSIEIIIPNDWQQNELFVLFLLQTKALSILEIPGFHRHIPSDLNNFSVEAKDDFFKFFNQFLKEIDGEFNANWQVYSDGMYWSFGIEVGANNEGDFANVDFSETAYEEDEYEDW